DRYNTATQFAAALSETVLPTAPPRGRLRIPTAARVTIALVLLVAIALGVIRTTSGPAVPVSSTRVAGLPFAVRGGEHFFYLAEGMVDLLSRNLDGAGDLRTIDPGTVL